MDTVYWLGAGVYLRANGVWRHLVTNPTRMADDYIQRYFMGKPVRCVLIDHDSEINVTLEANGLPRVHTYTLIDAHQAKIIGDLCQRVNVPFVTAEQVWERTFRKARVTYTIACHLAQKGTFYGSTQEVVS